MMMHSSKTAPILYRYFYKDYKAMALFIKGIIILFLILIFYSLGSALYFLMRDQGSSMRSVKALTWRITLSCILFILLIIAFALGWIAPHPIGG